MPTALTIVLAALALAWLALLVDCVRRDAFHGPFASPAADRAFWIVCLLLLDPPLAVVYLVFVRLRVAWDARWRPALFVALLALALALRLLPLGEVAPGRHVATRGADGAMDTRAFDAAESGTFSLALQGHIAHQGASSGHGTGPGSAVCARRIRVQLLDDDPTLRRVALHLGRALAELPFVDRVECALVAEPVLDAGPGPDLTVLLDLEIDSHIDLLAVGRTAGALRVAMSATPWRGDTELAPGDSRVGLARIDADATLRFEVWRLGYALGTARGDGRVDAMAGPLVRATAGALQQLVDRVGALPPTPPAWTGAYEPPADVRTLAEQLGGALVRASSGTLADARMTWTLELEDVGATFDRVARELAAMGFDTHRREAPGAVPILDATREDARVRSRLCLCAAAWPRGPLGQGWPDGDTAEPESRHFVLTLVQDFAAPRLRTLAGDAIDAGLPIELPLVLASYVPDDRRGALLERVGALRAPGGLLAAAQVAGDAGRAELQAELLRRGYEIGRALGHQMPLFTSAAERAGIALPERGAPLDVDRLEVAGFARARAGEPLELPFGDLAAGVDLIVDGSPPVVLRLGGGDGVVRYGLSAPTSGGMQGTIAVDALRGEDGYTPIGLMDGQLRLRVVAGDGAERLEVLVTQH